MCGLFRYTLCCAIWIAVSWKVECFLVQREREQEAWQRRPRLANGTLACQKPNIYICEEPPDAVPPEHQASCNYRNQQYQLQVYRWVGGRGCLLYTPDFLYVGGANPLDLNAGCFYGNLYAPCLELPKEDGSCGCYPFDPGLEEVAAAVRGALVGAAHGRWERCFYAAADCCRHSLLEDAQAENKCPTTFDGWTCWSPAEGGTVANEVCSEFAYSGQGPSCNHFSNKECHENLTWELQTDYSTCSITPRLLRRYRFYIAVLAFSIACCLPAVFVFLFYQRLRSNTRVALHRNLLIAIILRSALVIVSRSEIYIDELTSTGETVMSTHSVACRVLAVAERVAANAVFACMLVEGVYLHRLIVAVFRKKLNITWLYVIVTIVAIAPVIAWAVVMSQYDDHSCWLVYTLSHVQWVLDGPRVAILLLNTALFLDVLRVLLTKIRNKENANQLNTTKATLFLMPIFGVQFLLTALRPNTSSCAWEQAYYYVSYSVEGLQGFIVAMLYCYVNKEVHALVKATYKKTENVFSSRAQRDVTYPRTSGENSEPQNTYSTGVTPADDKKDQYATVKPKLHTAEIIQIQASEKLAEILEPVYETIGNSAENERYDFLERSDGDTDSGFIPNRCCKEEYYGFTNASSISIDCQDWIRCISSPSSSVYNNSLNDYEARYLERKFPNHMKFGIQPATSLGQQKKRDVLKTQNKGIQVDGPEYNVTESLDGYGSQEPQSEFFEDCANMLREIMQYMDSGDSIKFDPSLLSPNRKEEDKVVFVDDVE